MPESNAGKVGARARKGVTDNSVWGREGWGSQNDSLMTYQAWVGHQPSSQPCKRRYYCIWKKALSQKDWLSCRLCVGDVVVDLPNSET